MNHINYIVGNYKTEGKWARWPDGGVREIRVGEDAGMMGQVRERMLQYTVKNVQKFNIKVSKFLCSYLYIKFNVIN